MSNEKDETVRTTGSVLIVGSDGLAYDTFSKLNETMKKHEFLPVPQKDTELLSKIFDSSLQSIYVVLVYAPKLNQLSSVIESVSILVGEVNTKKEDSIFLVNVPWDTLLLNGWHDEWIEKEVLSSIKPRLDEARKIRSKAEDRITMLRNVRDKLR